MTNNLDSAKREALERWGSPIYYGEETTLRSNYDSFVNSLRRHYSDSLIAYSYKTNYTPHLCQLLDDWGAWAEVVSGFEMDVALKLGVDSEKILFNGPAKSFDDLVRAIEHRVTIHLDNIEEWEQVKLIETKHKVSLAIRLNFDLSDGYVSRFGFEADHESTIGVLREIVNDNRFILRGVHIHYSTAGRTLDSFELRLSKLLSWMDRYLNDEIEYVDCGGGFFSAMPVSLKKEFSHEIPSLSDYGDRLGETMKKRFGESGPKLIIEPGTALMANVFSFICEVTSLKTVRNKQFATCNGSIYNIKPTLHQLQMPYQVMESQESDVATDVVGYTCKDNDVLIRDCMAALHAGTLVEFQNVGAYTFVLKPPFIEPDFPVIFKSTNGVLKCIKRRETVDDLLATYS